MGRGNRGLQVDPGGNDSEALIVRGEGGEDASVDRFVQVKHQPRNESNGHAAPRSRLISTHVYRINHSPTSKCAEGAAHHTLANRQEIVKLIRNASLCAY
jgi:hypothetical protein